VEVGLRILSVQLMIYGGLAKMLAVLTRIIDEDCALVLRVFRAAHSRRC
jgi:hypothetical protein